MGKIVMTKKDVVCEGLGEELILESEFEDAGYGDFFINQVLTLQTKCSSVILDFNGLTIYPENLRKLADHLENSMKEAREICRSGMENKGETNEKI